MEWIALNSWEEFEQHVTSLNHKRNERQKQTGRYVSPYLFRGQADNTWRLETTLERFLARAPKSQGMLKLKEYYRVLHAVKPQVETFTSPIWEKIPSIAEYHKGLDTNAHIIPGEIPAYDFLVYLRHHGFPSPLLDWTKSPYVAAYFALRDVTSAAEYASIYAYCEYTQGHKGGSIREPEIAGLGPYVKSHKRHFLQQSDYTICTVYESDEHSYVCHEKAFEKNTKDQDELWKFDIPTKERFKILKKLEQFNITAFSLFGSDESLMETVALRELLRHE